MANNSTDYNVYLYDDYQERDLNFTKETYPRLTNLVIFFYTYYIPTVIVIGLTANILSFVVFVSTYLNRLSLSVYLSAIAVADSGFLAALSVGWLDHVGIALFHTNGWCQTTVFMSYVCSFLSAWLVICFTIERYIAICYPLRRPEMCTVNRAKIVVISLFVFAILSYAITLKTTGVQAIGKYIVCHQLDKYSMWNRGLTYVDAIVTFIVPLFAILGFNIRIVHKISYFYNKKRHDDPRANHIYCTTKHHHNSNKVCLRNRAQVKVTKFLLIISTVFLVINLPAYVLRILAFINNVLELMDTRFEILIQQLFQFLFYLNFSINFFLYIACSSKFREGLRRLIMQTKLKMQNCFRRAYNSLRNLQSTTPRTTRVA